MDSSRLAWSFDVCPLYPPMFDLFPERARYGTWHYTDSTNTVLHNQTNPLLQFLSVDGLVATVVEYRYRYRDTMSKQHWTEEELVSTLSGVLLREDQEIDGLDEDLVVYLAGLIATQLLDAQDEDSAREVLEESMIPFLESVGCPPDLMQAAVTAITSKAQEVVAASSELAAGARKLKQGIVQMSSTLTEQDDEDANRFMWGTGEKLKANANVQKDAYNDKTSAKDRRKQRQELEKARRELAAQQQRQETSAKAGVSVMLVPTVKSKERDVNLQGITLSLDNGTILLEHGDLKFAYQRRYGLVSLTGSNELGVLVMVLIMMAELIDSFLFSDW